MPMPWSLLLFLSAIARDALAYDAPPRWGQAAVVINDVLYVYGGKTDEFNQFSYTSAPNTNDVLYLSLASSFPASDPPWLVASGTHNTSSQQGPALAWHSAAAYNSSQIIVFGGLPDVNSDTVQLGNPDSAIILDVWDRLGPIWSLQPDAWANQPTRRIRHSTATIPTGHVFIFGGERADGSNIAFDDNYVFDPNGPSFTLLPKENGPPDLVGHVSIPLPDGRILVFGGYIPSQGILLLMSTVYVLDTTRQPYSWSTLRVSSGALPNARRAFAATLVSPTRILIHGGSDAHMQTTLDDGWMLDLTQPDEAVWTRVDSLSGVGARRDHFAVTSGDNVVFGFGYSQSAPADEPVVQVYNLPGSSLVETFTPRPPTSTPYASLPPFTTTPTSRPTSTSPIEVPGATHTDPPTTTPSDTSPNKPDEQAESSKNRTTKIAVGTSLGVVALAALLLGAAYYRYKKNRRWEERRFWVIDGDDHDDRGGLRNAAPGPHLEDDDSQFNRDIPLAGANKEPMSEAGRGDGKTGGILGALGLAGLAGLLTGAAASDNAKSRNPREVPERRNMLDDEDNADYAWRNYNAKRREGTGGSSWSLMSMIPGRNRNRESASSTPWREKDDPFGDGASLMLDEETGLAVATATASRPRARREQSGLSSVSGYSYTDPFSDPIQEEARGSTSDLSNTAYQDHGPSISSGIRMLPPGAAAGAPPVAGSSFLPLTDFTAHALSPLTEHTSQSTLAMNDSGSSSHNVSVLTPFSSLNSRATSHTTPGTGESGSFMAPKSPTLLSGFLPPVRGEDEGGVKRSDSWWTRLARRASDASAGASAALHQRRQSRSGGAGPSAGGGAAGLAGFGAATRSEIRDPNPPPTTRLSMIVERVTPPESEKTGSAGSRGSAAAGGGVDSRGSSAGVAGIGSGAVGTERREGLYKKVGHGKSMSSVKTADSEMIERMGGMVDVVHRLGSEDDSIGGYDLRRGGSLSSREMSINEEDEEDHARFSMEVVASPVEMEYHREVLTPRGSVAEEGVAGTGVVKAPVPVRPIRSKGSAGTSSLLGSANNSKGSLSPSPVSSGSASRASSRRTSPRPMGPRSATPTLLSPANHSGSSLESGASSGASGHRSAPPSATGPGAQLSVAARVRALEAEGASSGKRASVAGPRASSLSATAGGGERRSKLVAVDYGLVPRRSLFVANPDNKRASVGSEESLR